MAELPASFHGDGVISAPRISGALPSKPGQRHQAGAAVALVQVNKPIILAIPDVHAGADPSSLESNKSPDSPDRAVLVVDDDQDLCHNMADILADLGYHVDTAHDGCAALTLARGQTYNVTLLDLKLPGMDGLALSREIKRLCPGTIAFLITGYPRTCHRTTPWRPECVRSWQSRVVIPRLLAAIERTLTGPCRPVFDMTSMNRQPDQNLQSVRLPWLHRGMCKPPGSTAVGTVQPTRCWSGE